MLEVKIEDRRPSLFADVKSPGQLFMYEGAVCMSLGQNASFHDEVDFVVLRGNEHNGYSCVFAIGDLQNRHNDERSVMLLEGTLVVQPS